MLAKVCTHCASKSSAPITLPALSTATWPAMNRYSDAFTRAMCEYCPSGLPSASGLRSLMSGIFDLPCYPLKRHARPCAGHPRLRPACKIKDVDGRDEPGHDDGIISSLPM